MREDVVAAAHADQFEAAGLDEAPGIGEADVPEGASGESGEQLRRLHAHLRSRLR
jgi:hypothetical protein